MIGFSLVYLPLDMRREWSRRVDAQGNTHRKGSSPITYSEVKSFGRLYLSGYSVCAIAKMSECNESRVYNVLRYTGMPLWMKQMNTFNRNRRKQNKLPVSVNRYMWYNT